MSFGDDWPADIQELAILLGKKSERPLGETEKRRVRELVAARVPSYRDATWPDVQETGFILVGTYTLKSRLHAATP